jgi:hypothetical protein
VEKSATVAEDDSAEQPLRKFVMALPMPITVSQYHNPLDFRIPEFKATIAGLSSHTHKTSRIK